MSLKRQYGIIFCMENTPSVNLQRQYKN
jgi:hypothetical protein